jgi:ectoine hydroxylase-related dioxygenase (phytanoyl-CoA dioxygenase family)|tara:strand:+ start:585 stop:791 length:207 start_codon:yes stop_codon:yes gene_type:complete
MPAGSLFFWLGGSLRGAGANSALDRRHGVVLTYSPGWVRQEENQYRKIPKHILNALTLQQKSIVGCDM